MENPLFNGMWGNLALPRTSCAKVPPEAAARADVLEVKEPSDLLGAARCIHQHDDYAIGVDIWCINNLTSSESSGCSCIIEDQKLDDAASADELHRLDLVSKSLGFSVAPRHSWIPAIFKGGEIAPCCGHLFALASFSRHEHRPLPNRIDKILDALPCIVCLLFGRTSDVRPPSALVGGRHT